MINKPVDNLAEYLKELTSDPSNEAIAQAEKELQDYINAEKLAAASRLAGWLAHKINNPLGAILGNAQLLARRLERDINDPEALEKYLKYTDGIQAQTERCAEITGELFNLTRPYEPGVTEHELSEIISDAVELAKYGRDGHEIDVNVENITVKTDRELLVKVVYEVVANALHAVTENGGSVAIDAEKIDDNLCITVRDTGLGMHDEVLTRAFDPFYSTREKAKGLGLTTSLSGIQQLGGTLEVAETGTEGTTIIITHPMENV